MFVFLSGRDKGKTRIYQQDRVSIGTSDACDLVLSVNAARATGKLFDPPEVLAHVKRVDGVCQLVLKCGDSLPVEINGERLGFEAQNTPTPLYDGDSIRFGEAGRGVELLFHVLREDFRALQPVPKNQSPDQSMTPEVPATVHPLTATLFVKELATSLWAEVPRRAKVYTLVGAAAVLAGIAVLIVLNFRQLNSNERRISDLMRNLEGSQQQSAIREAELAEQQKRLDELQQLYERNRSFAQTISEQYAPGVCLIVGSYTFVDKETGRPLRYQSADLAAGPIIDEAGELLAAPDGLGAAVEVEFTGTGFLVGQNVILTNRHVLQPWWRDDTAQMVIARGTRPRVEAAFAYFPQVKRPFPLKLAGVSDGQDLAVATVDLGDIAPRVLPLAAGGDPPPTQGRAIVLLGYPAGVEALVERLPEAERLSLGRGAMASLEMAQALAARGAVRPLAAQGIIGDVVPGRIVHNAVTAEGGSGGPLFDDTGKVVGINAAILINAETGMPFPGSNFAIPIAAARPLIAAVAGPGTEVKGGE